MKIGILTFHSQLNYGGVLQCWALQTALEQLGHEVVVIDRWLDSDNFFLERGYDQWNKKQWIKFCIRSLLGLGDNNQWLRARRTKKFLRKFIKLTPYHFGDWSEAPKELGVEMLVVGSDQVWHCGDWGDPRVYLLEGAPKVPAIAYAASFGMTGIPATLGPNAKGASEHAAEPIYRRGLAKFTAISCREAEGASICRKLGFEAAHVVDPTLLLDCHGYEMLVGKIKTHKSKRLVCYLLGTHFKDVVVELHAFAKKTGCRVDVFLDQWYYAEVLPLPTTFAKAKRWLSGIKERLSGRIRIFDSAGPQEFIGAIANADWVVSDSFHALMFSCIFNKNLRILAPSNDNRRKMFARIEEFAAHTKGLLVVDSLAAALASFEKGETVEYDYEWVNTRRSASINWLRSVLA